MSGLKKTKKSGLNKTKCQGLKKQKSGLKQTKFQGLNKHNFRIAFTVESFLYPIQMKKDPKYVKYIVRMYGKRNGEYYQRILNYH